MSSAPSTVTLINFIELAREAFNDERAGKRAQDSDDPTDLVQAVLSKTICMPYYIFQ